MKVIGIVGSRSRDTGHDFVKVLRCFLKVYERGDEIVSGGCPKGADNFAERIAKYKQIPIKIYYAEWDLLGKKAGFVRNTPIALDATVLIACVASDRTGGTEDTIKKFQKAHPTNQLIIVD